MDERGGSREIAVFDLDGTLVDRGTVARFLRQLAGTGGTVRALLAGVRHAGIPPRRLWFKQARVGYVLRGRTIDEVRDEGRRFVETTLSSELRDHMVAEVRRHREHGHHLVLLTSGLDVYAEPLAASLGFDDVISTRVAEDGDRCTGDLLDANLVGLRKVDAILDLIGERGWDRRELTVHAYGDSADDRPLQAWARGISGSTAP